MPFMLFWLQLLLTLSSPSFLHDHLFSSPTSTTVFAYAQEAPKTTKRIINHKVLQHKQPPYRDDQEEESPKKSSPPPHILFILVDDLGWGDVGFHSPEKNEEIQTPVMDDLVKHGIELNRHYVHSSCTGTRTSLQSGRFPVHIQTTLKNPEEPSSGMPRNLTGLAEHIKSASIQPKYAAHYVGKWDVGMATPKHTPKGRGYDTSLNYFEHKNDFWTQECAQSKCCQELLLNEIPNDLDSGAEGAKVISRITSTGATKNSSGGKIKDLWDTDKPANDLVGTDYEEFIFLRRMLEIIEDHQTVAVTSGVDSNPKKEEQEQPLFLFYAPHVAHCPLQVPQAYLDKFDFMDAEDDDVTYCQAQTANILSPSADKQPPYSCRKQYRAMVNLLDDIIGQVVNKLKQHEMWNNTLLVLTSDNGGPTHLQESASTNFPLRGGKYTDWEGGVRATAFVSGGYLPEHRRGQIVQDPVHISDWYVTLPFLASGGTANLSKQQQQEEETKSSALLSPTTSNEIPPIDGENIWPIVMRGSVIEDTNNNAKARGNDAFRILRRKVIPLSEHSLIIGDYKLLWNENQNISIAGWTSPNYPNKQTPESGINDNSLNCTLGCLFDVANDPGEHNDIAEDKPFKVEQMKRRLRELRKGFYENNERGQDSCPTGWDSNDDRLPCACWMAVNYYGGFLGPYQEVDIS